MRVMCLNQYMYMCAEYDLMETVVPKLRMAPLLIDQHNNPYGDTHKNTNAHTDMQTQPVCCQQK